MGACNRHTFEAVWLSLQQFSRGVRLFVRFLRLSDLTVRPPAVLSVEVRRGPNFFPVLICHRPTFWSKQCRLHSYEGGTSVRSVRLLLTLSMRIYTNVRTRVINTHAPGPAPYVCALRAFIRYTVYMVGTHARAPEVKEGVAQGVESVAHARYVSCS